MAKTDAKVRRALEAADYLTSIESPRSLVHAESVRSLCRANSSLAETCSRLSRDNEQLRKGQTDA